MERPRTVNDLLDAYHSSVMADDEGDRTWVDIKFAIAEAMDQEDVPCFYHAASGTLFRRTADDLIVSPCRDTVPVPLAAYIARSIAPVYARLLAELDIWLGWERREPTGSADRPWRVSFRDAEGVERSCCPEGVDVAGGVFRVRRADSSTETIPATRPGSVAVTTINRASVSPEPSPLFFVRADQIMPATMRRG